MSPLYWRPGQRSAVSIGGNRPNANYFLLDGATNTDPTFNTLNLSPSPDAVQEFRVQTGSYSPMGDTYIATPMHAWDTVLEARDTLSWRIDRHSLKLGGSYRHFIWPMWGLFQNRGYYQFTNGFTTQTATNDGSGSALASFLLGLPAVKQRQAGIPQMQLRSGTRTRSFRTASNSRATRRFNSGSGTST